jgi:WXXGXW repeat (2 copies)
MTGPTNRGRIMRRLFHIGVAGGLALAGLTALAPFAPADQTPPPPLPSAQANRGFEIQSQGPVHQAFAQPGEMATDPSVAVPKRPPDPIPELPPAQKPDGKNVQWIPGYWHWDMDKSDYIWISGVYRDVPPGRKWVAGSWTSTADGKWRFVDGYWAGANQAQREYVPAPPASLENGPSAPVPDDNAVYTPGNWVYQDQRYLWQPGYYAAPQPGRVWVSPRYVWTPAGCVYVSGYWDYPLEARGYLYPSVYFTQPLWLTPGWCYQPAVALDFAPIFSSFFVGPGYHHYFYGNYVGSRFAALGFRPWYGHGRWWGDGLWNYYGWRNRGNPGWVGGWGRSNAGFSGRGYAGNYGYATVGHFGNGGRGFATPANHFAGNHSFASNGGLHGNASHGVRNAGAGFHSGLPAGHVAHVGAQHFSGGHNVQHFASASVHHAAPAHNGSSGHGGGGGHGGTVGHGGGGHGGGHGGGGHGGGGHGGGGHGGGGGHHH